MQIEYMDEIKHLQSKMTKSKLYFLKKSLLENKENKNKKDNVIKYFNQEVSENMKWKLRLINNT
ncbi:MAG: hypothetical protein SOZ23_02560 [Methanosphaera sp.]|uniref:hypothetical protein n=1 Tax=Methanosphaera sp. TaxID=2666342 RepID=UPI0025F591D6|nr:hypothetical protein [Methanosphaera sp.]MCI5867259.1 hypothetical protein [Methanosphaera sp.]MDD6534673.1 hypothetical protein [Methanosphaera sp.]MDY3955659.1 hypothetical protein [Methanosphaera sp.]